MVVCKKTVDNSARLTEDLSQTESPELEFRVRRADALKIL